MTTQRVLKSLFPIRTGANAADWQALYTALYNEHLPRIYRFFCYRVYEGPTAEDLTSMTFEKAWRARHRYRQDLAAFTTWLYSIARNVANDYFRQHHPDRAVEIPLDEHVEASQDLSPEAAFQQQDEFAQLTRLMMQLPQRDREVLALKFGAALSHADIARVLGLSQGNVAVIAHRALQRLREQWPADQDRDQRDQHDHNRQEQSHGRE